MLSPLDAANYRIDSITLPEFQHLAGRGLLISEPGTPVGRIIRNVVSATQE